MIDFTGEEGIETPRCSGTALLALLLSIMVMLQHCLFPWLIPSRLVTSH